MCYMCYTRILIPNNELRNPLLVERTVVIMNTKAAEKKTSVGFAYIVYPAVDFEK